MIKQNTPLVDAIEKIKTLKSLIPKYTTTDKLIHECYDDCIEVLQDLIEKERQVIIQSFDDGFSQGTIIGEEYFRDNFKIVHIFK